MLIQRYGLCVIVFMHGVSVGQSDICAYINYENGVEILCALRHVKTGLPDGRRTKRKWS